MAVVEPRPQDALDPCAQQRAWETLQAVMLHLADVEHDAIWSAPPR